MAECTTVMLCEQDGTPVVELIALDVHGQARSNKMWYGRIWDMEIKQPNLAAVEAFAAEHGWTVDKL